MIWLQNADGRPLPKDLDVLERPNKGRLADIEQRASAESDRRLMARITYGPDERRAYGPSEARRSNPAPTDADMRHLSRQIDRMLGLDDLSGKPKPKPKPKPTYEIELRKGDHVEVYKFKTKKEAVARFEESAAKAEASNDPRFAGLIISLYCGGALTEEYRKAAKKATKRK